MNELFIRRLTAERSITLTEASHILETQTVSNPIHVVNWKKFAYCPRVNFRIGHIQDEIWLKYTVSEKHILALETQTNGPVHKDSCVEFFISADGKDYYNLEVNCIGTVHLAHGPSRSNRECVSPDIIREIAIESSLGNQPFEEKTGDFYWEIMIRIPLKCLAFDHIKSLSGLKATANFYKCGDATSEPHFLTWNSIETETPDYHRPEFFGSIFFE